MRLEPCPLHPFIPQGLESDNDFASYNFFQQNGIKTPHNERMSVLKEKVTGLRYLNR